jgi:DNA polymerase III epsilon subunit-like protein
MKYISIDVETTGIDPETCQILSIGAVIEDTLNPLPFEELPKFHAVIKRENVYGSLFALNMNKDLIETIVQYSTAKDQDEKNDIVNMTGMQFYEEEDVVEALFHFCYDNGLAQHEHIFIPTPLPSNMPKIYLNCAGKNFAGFDRKFLEKLPRWKQVFSIRSRVLDPGILFVDWNIDEIVPSLDECKKRAGIEGVVTHNAVEDAMDVVMLLRKCYQ